MSSRFEPRQRRAILMFGVLCAVAVAFMVLSDLVTG